MNRLHFKKPESSAGKKKTWTELSVKIDYTLKSQVLLISSNMRTSGSPETHDSSLGKNSLKYGVDE
ncbi:MAG: hypothetical protein A4E74_01260 [Syntrophus sp. PtaB.Bin075]|nr:MAG: hypothetical protein A4E74_01260 [Syntrophus sp. PtaB.Bin075]